jgi:L-ribulose-5-phosphate 3-epimerase
MKRRAFHRLVAAAVLSRHLTARSADQFDHQWKLGIITDQVDLDLKYVLTNFYPKYQLRWAEIRYLKLDGAKRYVYADATSGQLKHVKQQLDDGGIKLSVLDTAVFKVALPGTTPVGEGPAYVDPNLNDFARQMEDLRRAAETAHALGTDRVRIFTFRRVAQPAAVFGRVVEELQRALDVAKSHDVTLLVENEYDCNIGTSEETATLFRAIPDWRLMHNWDPCNVYEMSEQPFPKGWDQLDHRRIGHIHLKDALGKDWKSIGTGEIDFEGLFRALKRVNYAGTMSVETRFLNARKDQYASSVESMDGLVRVLKKI